MRKGSRTRRAFAAGVTAMALLPITLLAAPAARATSTCVTPPEVLPQADIVEDMTGYGYTALDGTTPQIFYVRVVAVLPDGIQPGVDFVMFKITGPKEFLQAGQGVSFGMSGSPVYLDGKLAGAVAYKFYYSDPTFGGMTPAEPMTQIFDYEMDVAQPATAPKLPQTIDMPASARNAFARAAGEAVADAPTTASRLMLPLAVSGASDEDLTHLQEVLDEHQTGLYAYRAGSADVPAVIDPTPLDPGEPFAAVLSYGDVTWAGIGTATAVCGDAVLAFGHPFFYNGESSMGMHAASIATVLKDSSNVVGPRKIGNITELHGTLTQDRSLGVLGIAGMEPPAGAPITSTYTYTDYGRTLDGESQVVSQEERWIFPEVAWEHTYGNFYSVWDHYGPGTLRVEWTITGTLPDGSPFTVDQYNMRYSGYSASWANYSIIDQLWDLAYNRYKRVTFTGLDVTGEVTEQQREGKIVKVLSKSDKQGSWAVRKTILASPGSTVRFRIVLDPVEAGPRVTVDASLKVPNGERGRSQIEIRAGKPPRYYSSRGFDSFRQFLKKLNGGEHSDELIVKGLDKKLSIVQDFIVKGEKDITIKVEA